MGIPPLCNIGDRTDFVFDGDMLVGTVEEVHIGEIRYGCQMEHQYTIRSNNVLYRVAESNVSSPYDEEDNF